MIQVTLVCEGIDGDDTACGNSLHMPLKGAVVNVMALRLAAQQRGWSTTSPGQFLMQDWCPMHRPYDP